MKIKSIHFFRGIAILFIIAGHFITTINMGVGIESKDKTINKIIFDFIYGGTGYFVFIFGFLFFEVFYKKFRYIDFIKKKIQNVFIPFCILSIYPIINMFFIDKNYAAYGAEYNVISAIEIVLKGNHMNGYWYIYFIMVVFAISPLYIKYIETKYKGIILFISIIISFFLKRGFMELNPFPMVIYFSSFYLLGIYTAVNREKIIKKFENKKIILIITIFLLEVINNTVLKNYNVYDKPLLTKLICCILIFLILTKYENKKLFILDKIAEYSFAIFFLHAYLIRVFENRLIPLMKEYNFFLIFFSEMIITLAVCILVAATLKKILGKYSRYIIGY